MTGQDAGSLYTIMQVAATNKQSSPCHNFIGADYDGAHALRQ